MPLGIINVGTTYQMMVNNIFAGMIRDTIEAYVNDILVTSKIHIDRLRHLEKVF